MQTHSDNEHNRAASFMDKLRKAAEEAQQAGTGRITAGAEGERVLATYEHNGMHVVQRPDDPHGILRISVGGGATPVPLDYCTFRGDRAACLALLKKAVAALERG